MPPRWTEPVSRGLYGSLTSYCFNSPVPQHETYSHRSSTERSISVTSGGTAAKGWSAGGSSEASAGSAGVVVTFFTPQAPLFPGHNPTDPDRVAAPVTTPTDTPTLR